MSRVDCRIIARGWAADSGRAFTGAASKGRAQEYPLHCQREQGRPEGVTVPARTLSGSLYWLLMEPGKPYCGGIYSERWPL